MSTDPRSRAWVELDGSALRRNVERIRALGGGAPLLPMVKADAYGLGVSGVVPRLEPLDPVGYGVATLAEGIELRSLGVRRPVLLFTPLAPGQSAAVLDAGVTPTLSSIAALDEWGEAVRARGPEGGAPVEFHLEIDTGMGRAGVPWREVVADPSPLRAALLRCAGGGGVWAGCFTHFHSADEPGAPGVPEQSARLEEVVKLLQGTPRADPFRVHLANSAAAVRRLPGWGDFVRPGIHLYGGSVGEELYLPDPVVSLRARVVRVREAEPGETVGYGATHRAAHPERWATVALGYADGLPRALGNCGRALLRGESVPLVGRVSMDMVVLEVGRLPGPPVEEGEVATFIGRDGSGEIRLEEVAALAGTIGYEILTGLGRAIRLPRIWVDGSGDDEAGELPGGVG
jgi:alanine racemase